MDLQEKTTKDQVREKLEVKLGRPVSVQKLEDGKFVIEYFNFNTVPPPSSTTELGALIAFDNWYRGVSDESRDNTDGQGSEEA